MQPDDLTHTVLQSFQFADPRHAELLRGLVTHLHTWARETRLTHAEWRQGLGFLTDAAAITTGSRNEFSLLSDVLGLSSLVDLQHSAAQATPSSVLGPFHVHDSLWQDNGADLVAGQAGEATFLTGQVMSVGGQPLQAELDFWQNADNGLYPSQDEAQDPHNLRCRLHTDAAGRFSIRTLKPRPYSVPQDGPVAVMLRAAGRDTMRPAHFHVIVSAQGHRPIVTELFPDDDTCLQRDAVFGVRPALVVPFVRCDDPAQSARDGMPCPHLRVDYNFRLAPLAAGVQPGPEAAPPSPAVVS